MSGYRSRNGKEQHKFYLGIVVSLLKPCCYHSTYSLIPYSRHLPRCSHLPLPSPQQQCIVYSILAVTGKNFNANLQPTLSPLIPAPCCPLGPLGPGSPRSPCGTESGSFCQSTSKTLAAGSQPSLHCSQRRQCGRGASRLLYPCCD